MINPHQITNAIESNLAILLLHLTEAAELARLAYAAQVRGEQNLALGTISSLEQTLPTMQMLYGAAKALHCYEA